MFPPYAGLVPYGTLELTEASPAQSFTEPFALEQVISFLHLPAGTPEGETLADMITAARSMAEAMQNRDLVRKQWDLSLDYWPAREVPLRPHLASVDLVRTRDYTGSYTDLVEDTHYVVDLKKQPGILTPPWGTPWPTYTPWPSSSLLVRFTSGLASDSLFWQGPGARVKMGMRLLISEWFANRIPFGAKVEELPYKITKCLSFGALARVK